MYDFELSMVKQAVKEAKPKTVLIQLPPGLRSHTIRIVEFIEGLGPEVVVWGGSCYGACDTPDYKTDLLIQFGHEELN